MLDVHCLSLQPELPIHPSDGGSDQSAHAPDFEGLRCVFLCLTFQGEFPFQR